MKKPVKKNSMKFVFFIFLALCFRFFVEPYQVSTSEMAPTLLKGDYVWVLKKVYGFHLFQRYLQILGHPKRGEVVLLKEPHPPYHLMFKRVMGLPGDRLFYSKGVLFINEKMYKPQIPLEVKSEWDFLKPSDFSGENGTGGMNNYVHWQEELSYGPYSVLEKDKNLSFGPYKIPKGHYFVMGDHRSQSRDSRTWSLQSQRAQGVVVFHKKSKEPLKIPKDTVLYAGGDPYFPVRFITLKSVLLEDSPLSVPVRALDPGLTANIEKNSQWRLSSTPEVSVTNDKEFSGGQDKSLVPFHSIKGRPVLILWGCEKTLPLLNFLCQFDSFRKKRWLWPVHKKTKGKLNDSK